MKKTAQELIDIIQANDMLKPLFDNDWEGFEFEVEGEDGEEDYKTFETLEEEKEYVKNLFGELKYEDYRMDTSEFWQVIYFKDHDVYLEISGEYDSYGQGDHDYSSIKEVKPKQITTIIYE